VYPAEIVPTPDQLTMSISIKLGFSPIRMLESDFRTILSNSVRGHTDGHNPYLEAVEDAFGADVDYAQLQKVYGASLETELGTRQQFALDAT